MLFATVRQKIKGILQYPIPAHTSLYICVRECARVCMCVCGCCGLSAAAWLVCGLWFLLGAISQWAAKLLQFECAPVSDCTFPHLTPLAMRLNNSLTAVCLPFVIGEAFAFAFCLCSSMCGEFFYVAWFRIGLVCRFMEIVQYFQCEWGFRVFIFVMFGVFFHRLQLGCPALVGV